MGRKFVMEELDFFGRVEKIEVGNMWIHIIPVPDDVVAILWDAGVRRVIGEINGHAYNRGIMGSAKDGRYLFFGKKILNEFGVRAGSRVEVTIAPDPDPNRVEVPQELELALAHNDEARARWETFTPGRKRGLCHHVISAKRKETRIRRSVELAEKIRQHQLHDDK